MKIQEDIIMYMNQNKEMLKNIYVNKQRDRNLRTEVIDYDKYKIDSTVPHSLTEELKYKRPRPNAFEIEGNIVNVTT